MALSTEVILTLQQLKGIGTKSIIRIAESGMDASSIEELQNKWGSLKGKVFEKISTEDLYEANKRAVSIINESYNNDVGIISYFDKSFPDMLKKCINPSGKLDPVILLFYRGNLNALAKPGIAIIGTREPTQNGIKAGKYFAEKFAERGFNIISGLAIGCDTMGHKGALSVEGGTTTAFLANGLDWESIYPKENLELAKSIVANGGLLLSEYPIGQRCSRYSLVARDRLQSGLSYATIAVQTGIKGGTMHAVNATLHSNKPLFMVKFKNIEDLEHEKVQGNNELISEGKAHPLGAETLEAAFLLVNNSMNTQKGETFSTKLF